MADETVVTPASTLTDFQTWEANPDVEVSSEAEIDTVSETEPASDPVVPVAEEQEEALPKGLKKRFSSLTTEIRELKAQLAKTSTPEKPGVATLPEVAKADQAGKPVAANFTTYEEYVEALTDWKIEARDALKAEATARETQQATVRTQVAAAKQRYADYDDVVNNDLPISAAMAEVMVGSEHGADIAYFLGRNPDVLAAVAKMSPAATGAALARIEAGLNLETSVTPPKTPKIAQSKAPAPPKTLVGGGGNADAEPDPKNFTAWNKWADREEKRKRGDD